MEWGEIVENLQALPELPTPQNVTVRSPRPRDYLTEREVEKLMDAARANRWGHRDATAILLAYRHGLRASELVALRWDDINLQAGKLHVRRSKGGETSVHLRIPTIVTTCSDASRPPVPIDRDQSDGAVRYIC